MNRMTYIKVPVLIIKAPVLAYIADVAPELNGVVCTASNAGRG